MSVGCYILFGARASMHREVFRTGVPELRSVPSAEAEKPAALIDEAEAVDTMLHLALPFLASHAADEA